MLLFLLLLVVICFVFRFSLFRLFRLSQCNNLLSYFAIANEYTTEAIVFCSYINIAFVFPALVVCLFYVSDVEINIVYFSKLAL